MNTVIGSASASGDSSITYSLEGEKSSDFLIDDSGSIKVAKNLNYSDINQYDLSVIVKGRFDTMKIPVSIKLSKNIDPDFNVNCKTCSFAENSSAGETLISANRTDFDSDSISYKLENTFGNKFSIDSQTGEVKLNDSLDYEASSSYELKVIATDSKGVSKEVSSTINVTNITHNIPSPNTPANLSNSNVIVKNAKEIKSSEEDEFLVFVPEDITYSDSSGKIILDVNQNTFPEGTHFSVSDANNSYEVDTDGIVKIKDDALVSSFEVNEFNEAEQIEYLKGEFSSGTDPSSSLIDNSQSLTIKASNIPQEPDSQATIKIVPKNVESQENVVMKFASGYSDVTHDINSNPFSATATRQGVTRTESTLSKSDIENNLKLTL